MTIKVGKKKQFEQIKPGQVFAKDGTKYFKPEQNITYGIAIRLPDFKQCSFGNYDNVYFIGESLWEI